MRRRTFIVSMASALASGCASVQRAEDGRPAVLGVIEYGQSNSEAQAGHDAALLRTDYPSQLRMPRTAANNVWLGLATVGGRSLELPADAVTGLAPLHGAMGSATHGSSAGESMVLRLVEDHTVGAGQEVVLFNAAEGGQAIRKLARDAPAGFYGFINLTRAARAVDAALRAEGKRYVVRVIVMAQGETDQKDHELGSLQEQVRGEVEAALKDITGQREPVWLLTVQPSSFQDSSGGVQSILREHERQLAAGGSFFCLGPTYSFPFTTDYLHSTSVGHDMRGELYAVAYETLLRTGRWDVLRATGARVAGPKQIVVTLSEAAAIEEIDPVHAPAHLGISLAGGTIAALRVDGDRLVIDTQDAAAQVTAVRIALDGQGATRTAAGVPRTSVRSRASYGTYRNGMAIRKWLCHQEIALAAA